MSGYQKATSAQVRQVVERMVKAGLDERSSEVAVLSDAVKKHIGQAKRLLETVAELSRRLDALEGQVDDYKRITAGRFESTLSRLNKTQVAVSELAARIAGAAQTVSGYERRAGDLDMKIDQANRRMVHIEEVLLKNRAEAVNRLANQIGNAIAKNVID